MKTNNNLQNQYMANFQQMKNLQNMQNIQNIQNLQNLQNMAIPSYFAEQHQQQQHMHHHHHHQQQHQLQHQQQQQQQHQGYYANDLQCCNQRVQSCHIIYFSIKYMLFIILIIFHTLFLNSK